MDWAMVDARTMPQHVQLRSNLTPEETDGVRVLVVVSSVSLAAVVTLLFIILITALRANLFHKSSSNIFRSHVTAYLISLLASDLLQAIGSIMNSKWVQSMAVSLGDFCTVQGAIKQAADVGTAFWVSAIAVHTFNVLVLGIHIRRVFMYIVLIGGWSFVGAVVAMGPLILQERSRGPYFAISGYWCWISKTYETEQFVLEYMMMFLSATISFVLYVLVFLKLRGNLLVLAGGRLRLRSVDRKGTWMHHQSYEATDLQAYMASVAKHMLLYPIAYIVLIVPIAACRFSGWMGHEVPLGAVIFSDSVFLLSGFVNALLFVLTGRVLPLREILNMFRTLSAKSDGRSVKLGSKATVTAEWDCETRTTCDTSSICTDKLQYRFEKDLPRLPVESHSVVIHTPHSISLGRKNSEPFAFSENSCLMR